jgi:hypothetical protein
MKSKINLIIDVIMLIVMSVIAGLGLLIKYVLVPGFKRNEIYGKDIELFYLGYDRHWWGNVHYILSIILVSLVVLHIILHWKMIVGIFKKMVKIKSVRYIIGVFILVISIFLIGSTLFIKPQITEEISNHNKEVEIQAPDSKMVERIEIQTNNKELSLKESKHEHNNEENIKGSMTLNDIAEQNNISPEALKQQLNIPTSVSNNSKTGRLKREYHFEMDELREAVRLLKRDK